MRVIETVYEATASWKPYRLQMLMIQVNEFLLIFILFIRILMTKQYQKRSEWPFESQAERVIRMISLPVTLIFKFSDQSTSNLHLQMIEYKVSMSGFCKHFNLFLRKCDLFSTTQFLRYRGQPEYSTMTGGITSLLIIAVFIALFSDMGLKTARKELIESTVSHEQETDPSTANIKVSPEDNFMFMIGFPAINLNLPNVSYFDVTLKQEYYRNGIAPINSTQIPLVPCTQEHMNFDGYQDVYQKLLMYQAMCLPLGQTVTLGGRFSSDVSSLLSLTVKKCNTTANPNCLSDAEMANLEAAFGEWTFVTGFITMVINPSQQKYVQIQLEDRNFFSFSMTQNRAVSISGYITEIQVETDESLMPYQDVKKQVFYSPNQLMKSYTSSVINDTYATLSIRKAAVKVKYTRSFNKVDDFFSYVGGLIGTILGFIFILNVYSESAFGISMASQLFKDSDGKKVSSNGYHFGYWISVSLYRLLEFCGCCGLNWPKTQAYSKCLDQVQQQLDIGYIMHKLTLFDKAMSALFTQHQLETLYLYSSATLSQTERQRKKHQVRQKLTHQKEASVEFDVHKNDSEIEMHKGVRNGNDQSQSQQVANLSDNLSADISSMDDQDEPRMRQNLRKVMHEARNGNSVSQRILKDSGPQIMKTLKIDPEMNAKVYPEEEQEKKQSSGKGSGSDEKVKGKSEKVESQFEYDLS